MTESNGLVYIFTGDGKGKTSAALGMILRASCVAKKTAWVAWYKSNNWDISEKKLPQILSEVDFYLMGEGFYIKELGSKKQEVRIKERQLITGGKILDTATASQHKEAAVKALKKASQLLRSKKYFLVVCDEICNALHDGLLELDNIKELLKLRGQTHLVLTGRNASKELIDMADLVSEIKKIKHPYDRGITAQKALDF